MTAVAIRLTFANGHTRTLPIAPREVPILAHGVSKGFTTYTDPELGRFVHVTKVEYLPEEPPRT